ncbi:MAG: helix-turn-helix transcriptional regulator [Lachnospiraceae bacterium]|nr:helix-turn-helix transcriptional regulator [Lachnospiraceae bacterium]
MRENGIGQFIRKKREEKNLSQKDVCQGVCSIQKLSNIEMGERVPEIFLFESILQRIGVSPDDFEVVLFDDEYEEIALRDSIEAYIEQGCYDEAKRKLLLHYAADEKDIFRRQYYYQIMGILESANGNGTVAIRCIEQALLCTCPNFNVDDKGDLLLSTKEMECLCMIADEQMKLGEQDAAKVIVESLLRYVKQNTIQDIELVKTLPKIAYLLCLTRTATSEQVENLEICEQALKLLVECDSTVFLVEIMEILIQQYSERGLEKRVAYLTKQLDSLRSIHEEFGGCAYVTDSFMKWYKEIYRREYLLCKEMIKGERKARKLSVENLIEGIYQDPETLIRIEKGSQNPSQKKYENLMKVLGLPEEKYYNERVYEGEEVYQIKKKILYYFTTNDYESAKVELEKLALVCASENKISKQYLMRQEVMLEYEFKRIDAEAFCDGTIEALKKTYEGSVEEPVRIPTLGECNIFNNLAISYWKMGEIDKGIELYEKVIRCYETSQVTKRYHFRSISLLLRNYLLLLEESAKTERALNAAESVMRLEMMAHRGMALDFVCSELACIYGQSADEKSKSLVKKYLQYAFYLSDLFRKENDNKIIDNYYRKNYDSTVQWY